MAPVNDWPLTSMMTIRSRCLAANLRCGWMNLRHRSERSNAGLIAKKSSATITTANAATDMRSVFGRDNRFGVCRPAELRYRQRADRGWPYRRRFDRRRFARPDPSTTTSDRDVAETPDRTARQCETDRAAGTVRRSRRSPPPSSAISASRGPALRTNLRQLRISIGNHERERDARPRAIRRAARRPRRTIAAGCDINRDGSANIGGCCRGVFHRSHITFPARRRSRYSAETKPNITNQRPSPRPKRDSRCRRLRRSGKPRGSTSIAEKRSP